MRVVVDRQRRRPSLRLDQRRDAERRRIVTLDLTEAQPASPLTVVAEDAAVLIQASLVGGRPLARYLVDAKTEVRRFRTGQRRMALWICPASEAPAVFRARHRGTKRFSFSRASTRRSTIYRYDVAANDHEVWAEPRVSVDPAKLTVEQRFWRCERRDESPALHRAPARRRGSCADPP